MGAPSGGDVVRLVGGVLGFLSVSVFDALMGRWEMPIGIAVPPDSSRARTEGSAFSKVVGQAGEAVGPPLHSTTGLIRRRDEHELS